MPRDGSSIYHIPPGTQATPDTTVASAPYNAYTADVEQDLNAPRPIVAGGTGANNASQALQNLSGEQAKQLVTNFDSFPFVPGSFWCEGAATGSPVAGHGFTGIVYQRSDGASEMTIEARDWSDGHTPGIKYIREKKAGVWGVWSAQAGSVADLDATYVNSSGDTMTGGLTLQGASGAPLLATKNSTDNSLKYFRMGASGLLEILNNAFSAVVVSLTDAGGFAAAGSITAGSQSGVGTYYFGNSGAFLNYASNQFRFMGATILGCSANAMYLNIDNAAAGAGGTYNFNGSGTRYLTYDGTAFRLNGGPFVVNSDVSLSGTLVVGNSGTTGYYYFGSSGTKCLQYDGTSFVLTGGPLVAGDAVRSAYGYQCRSGISGTNGSQHFNLYWTAGVMQVWADATNMGNISFTSDYRIKKDVIDLPGMWDTVKALRPIKYTQAEFQPPAQKKMIAEQIIAARKAADEAGDGAAPKEINTAPMIPADDIERWGFIAHELQATLVPSAATGVKDAPDTIQSPNPFTVIAALTKALQEAMLRIEALEAHVAPR
jgi:hypothetical protein